MKKRIARHMALAIMSALAAGEALAKDPREGTLACVVEAAWSLDPSSGASGRWVEAPTSFILKIGTCAQVKAGTFKTVNPEACTTYRADGLVITTTIPDVGEFWSPASPLERLNLPNGNRAIMDGGVFDSRSAWDDSANTIPPRLQVTSALRFNFIQGQKAKGGDKMLWWSLRGHCTPFAG